jgi:hypothetical protein
MKYQYGEMFRRLRVPNMGRQGATWCETDPDGILVLMAHQNYFRRKQGKMVYEMPPDEPSSPRGPSARRSLDMIAAYFAEGRGIILPVGVFVTDGVQRDDGTWGASVFGYATGDYFMGRMRKFERSTGYLLCDVDSKHSV